MRGPAAELRAFVAAAIVAPVPRDHWEQPHQRRRRQWVTAVTLMAGVAVLSWALRIEPGDPTFYLATALLAFTWTIGAFASGPLHLGYAHTRSGGLARPGVQAVTLGVLLLIIFLIGGLAVAQVPVLRQPVVGLLDHARYGSLPLVAALTALNGIAEELYFRGALYAALTRRTSVLVSTALYTVTVLGSGIPLLLLAAALLGLVTALQRRVTGGVLAPIITHLIFSLGLLFGLPPVLDVRS